MLKLGIVGTAGFFLPGDNTSGTPRNAPGQFQVPLRIPPQLAPKRTDAATDYYEINIRPAQVDILPGKRTTIWGYDGMFPGPTIRARSGRTSIVRQINNLPVETNVHLHGGAVAPEHDGGMHEMIAPGSFREYVYPNNQIASTLWYHDHSMHRTARNVYMGLAGLYLIEDSFEAGLNLPSGEYDVPLMLQDRRFNGDGSFDFPANNHEGVNGDTILVNGVPQPYFRVAQRKYRFRILNASNSCHYELALSNGQAFPHGRRPFLRLPQPMLQIASDGGLLSAPVPRPTIAIAPAERVEVMIDFARYPLGAQIILKNKLGRGTTADVMRFDVTRKATDASAVPAVLRPIPPLDGAVATRNFELSINREGIWVINGLSFDHLRVDAQPKLGSTEIWNVINRSNVPHPFHTHLVMFQILDRNGAKPAAGEAGWKDTANVGPLETVRLIAKFDGFTGKYMFHCHNLHHEDHMMMLQFEVVL